MLVARQTNLGRGRIDLYIKDNFSYKPMIVIRNFVQKEGAVRK